MKKNKNREKVTLVSKASLVDIELSESEIIQLDTETSIDLIDGDKDLLKMTSVLLSTGINKNDDVFLPEEVLPARASGANKPVNIEHNDDDIIGNMVRTFVTSKSGEEITNEAIAEDPSIVPQEFDITNEAVIYKFNFPGVAQTIREKAEAGELFVSVEAWFDDYDYLLGNKVVARNDKTESLLEPRLKINGGKGFFNGERIGRVLRNIILGGVGVVEQPANPESVIKSVASVAGYRVQIFNEDIKTSIIKDLSNNNFHKEDDNMAMNDEHEALLKAQAEQIKVLSDRLEEMNRKEIERERTEVLKTVCNLSDEKLEKHGEVLMSLEADIFDAFTDLMTVEAPQETEASKEEAEVTEVETENAEEDLDIDLDTSDADEVKLEAEASTEEKEKEEEKAEASLEDSDVKVVDADLATTSVGKETSGADMWADAISDASLTETNVLKYYDVAKANQKHWESQ